MGIYETILARRTIRKFKQEKIGEDTLKKLVNAARHAPSAANIQPIKYIIVNDEKKVNEIFKYVKWAGYIAPHGNPSENEKPVAFIVILIDTEIKKNYYELDVGAAAQNIFLAAWEEGIGTCWIGAFDKDAVGKILNIDGRYIINTVVALGYMAEEPVVEDEKGSIKYYKDEKGVLHVPKRKLDDIIIKL